MTREVDGTEDVRANWVGGSPFLHAPWPVPSLAALAAVAQAFFAFGLFRSHFPSDHEASSIRLSIDLSSRLMSLCNSSSLAMAAAGLR
jgi:hypothetical protein